MRKICHTKRYAVIGIAGYLLWTVLLTRLLDEACGEQLPCYPQLEIVMNAVTLLLLPLFIRCVVLAFQERVLLQGGERGLALRIGRKNRGVIPWRNIVGFAESPDHRELRIYLQGQWDSLEGSGERFEIQTDETGKRMIPLFLRHKVNRGDEVRKELEAWQASFSPERQSTSFDVEETAWRRGAAMKKGGFTALLIPLYFVRGKYWVIMLLLYLLLTGWVDSAVDLARPWVLLLTAVPFLPVSILLRRLLGKGITALERRRERERARTLGL